MSNPNKIALVTGGSRGLGRNMSIALAKKGIDIIFTYHSNRKEADRVINEINNIGQSAAAFQLDTRNTGSFNTFEKEVKSYLEKEKNTSSFDFLINNAGTALYAPIMEVTEEQMDDIFNIHYKGVFFLTQKLLPHLNDGGAIINISSGLTRITMPGSSVYASMKTAVETFTRYLANELRARKVRANVVAPGAIETDFGGGRVRDNKELNAQIASFTALGRVGLPEDIGGVVAFLCTEEAYWINGQRIEVSGGQSL
jgi:NAD(P)-dependent dehydrogenase (short-subunit alcohol dehydrogenase family)